MALVCLSMMLAYILLRNQGMFPQNTLGFAYFRSLLQSITTILWATQTCIPKHTCHFMVLFSTFIHRHNGLGSEACVCTRILLPLLPFGPLYSWPLPLPSRQPAIVETCVLYPGSSHRHCFEETLSHPARVPVLTLMMYRLFPFCYKIHSNIYIKSSWSPRVFTFQAKHP